MLDLTALAGPNIKSLPSKCNLGQIDLNNSDISKSKLKPFLRFIFTITAISACCHLATSEALIKHAPAAEPPAKIKVVDSSLPIKLETVTTAQGTTTTQKYIEPEQCELSKNFFIKTDRYHLEKKEDFFLTRWVGHAFSCLSKIMFLNTGIGSGYNAQETGELLAVLEKNKQISNLTVRVNHNGVFKDTGRLFSDPQVVARNPGWARAVIGLPGTFLGEFLSELRRGDYYNPMTQTAILYSPHKSISLHEIGHHQDFQRFPSDWWYAASRANPALMIYQEYQASKNANDNLGPGNRWETLRFLVPAFCTYLLGLSALARNQLKKIYSEIHQTSISEIPNSAIEPFDIKFSLFCQTGTAVVASLIYSGLTALGVNSELAGLGFFATLVLGYKAVKSIFGHYYKDR